MSGVFICYRRSDSQGFAGRLCDDLIERFGEDQIFRDDEIAIGSDYTQVLQQSVSRCNVLLVVIGRHWLNASHPDGTRRIDDPEDWVRIEIETGLKGDALVIPVLVGGATMPAESEVPVSLQRLSQRQALIMSDRDWDDNLNELSELIEYQVQQQRPISLEVPAPVYIPDVLVARRFRSSSRWVNWFKKLVTTAFLLLLGYFVLENYVDPGSRAAIYKFVDEFRVFVYELAGRLMDTFRAS